MRVFASLGLLATVLALALAYGALAALGTGCGPSTPDPATILKAEAVASAHRACTAEAKAVKAMALALGESCDVQAAKLDELVHTNHDCKTYFGDAVITVKDICP